MANTLKFGASEWYGSEGNILAYNDENGNFKPLPFNFSRGSSATVVNKLGLIETVQANDARVDYLNNAKGALLIEPQRSNYLPNSDNGSNYTVFSATKTLNEVISLDGTLNSFTLEGNGEYNQVLGESVSITLPSAGDYTFSVFAKKGTNNFIQLFFNQFTGSSNGEAYFDLENGTTSSSFGKIEKYGNDWYKCSVVGTVVGSDLSGKFGFRISYTSSNFFFPTANDAIGKNAYFYGFQVEKGSYATSYIPTQGTAQTRLADSCNKGANDQVINSTEGVLYAEISFLESSSSANNQISLSDGSGNNRIMIYPLSNTQLGLRFNANGSQLVAQTVTVSSLIIYSKIAIKWGNGNYSLYQNGLKVYTQTIASTPTGLNKLNFSSVTETSNLKGNVKDVKIYNTVLSDSELAALTTI